MCITYTIPPLVCIEQEILSHSSQRGFNVKKKQTANHYIDFDTLVSFGIRLLYIRRGTILTSSEI